MQQCLNHRLVLASKAGQQHIHIPRDVEDIIYDILNIVPLTFPISSAFGPCTEGLQPTTRFDVFQCINALIDRLPAFKTHS